MNPSLPPEPPVPPFMLQDLAAYLQGTLLGDGATRITGVAGVDAAEPGDLVFAESGRFLAAALRSPAAAVLVTPELAAPAAKPLLTVSNPRLAFVQVLEMLAPRRKAPTGVHPSAHLSSDVELGKEISIGPAATVGAGVILGDRVIVSAGAILGDGCRVGDDTLIGPNVVLYPNVRIGRRCILHAGCILGADGFGYVPIGYGLKKVPHLGTVELGDEVEVGANSCIDRAKTGVTRIGAGTKIDNLVHIAHNVTVGQSCLIVAQTGIAGSVTIGNGVVLAGQAGVKDHVTLGDGARVLAQGGVIGNIPAGVTVSGYPARPHQEKMREHAALTALPEALKRLRALEKRLAALEAAGPSPDAENHDVSRAEPSDAPLSPEEAEHT